MLFLNLDAPKNNPTTALSNNATQLTRPARRLTRGDFKTHLRAASIIPVARRKSKTSTPLRMKNLKCCARPSTRREIERARRVYLHAPPVRERGIAREIEGDARNQSHSRRGDGFFTSRIAAGGEGLLTCKTREWREFLFVEPCGNYKLIGQFGY